MSMGLTEVNKENYQEEVVGSKLPVLVDFWGPRCAPCLALMPEVEKLALEYADKIKFCKLNAAENRRLCIDLKVMARPTFLFYKAGEVVDRLTADEVTKESVCDRLKSFV